MKTIKTRTKTIKLLHRHKPLESIETPLRASKSHAASSPGLQDLFRTLATFTNQLRPAVLKAVGWNASKSLLQLMERLGRALNDLLILLCRQGWEGPECQARHLRGMHP